VIPQRWAVFGFVSLGLTPVAVAWIVGAITPKPGWAWVFWVMTSFIGVTLASAAGILAYKAFRRRHV